MNQDFKKDFDKLRWDLLPWASVEPIVQVLTYGAKKYSDNSWQKVESFRYKGALYRHLVAFEKGELVDDESGLPHLAHALTNLVFLYYFYHLKNKEVN